MTINLGKRNLGAGTAASPGDTLYIPLAFFNDSGASIGIGATLAVTDIEVFKNGSTTQRATDSGYAILGDTGNFDNRIGFKGISISLFNTADDASFYANGSTYWVAIDSVTVDARTVRFFPAMFEIGEPRANVVQVDGDTGAADQLQKAFASGFADTGINQRLGQIQSDVDTGLRAHITDVDTGLHDTIADLDTGLRGILITTGVNVTRLDSDTGFADRLGKFASVLSDAGQIDTGTGVADTGGLANSVWNGTRAAHTTAGTFGEYVNADIDLIRGDTGGADRFYRYTQKLDTGGDATVAASVDTGQVNQAVWQANAQRKLTVDTGIADQVWMQLKAGYTADTGTFGEHLGGSLGGSATVDTGQINQAVWQANAARSITASSDTGINARFDRLGAATGSALSIDAATDNTAGGISGVTSGTTFVGSQTGTVANTSADDLSYHVITHSGNAFDIVYQFLIGGGAAPVLCIWIGYLTGNNDQFTISVWDHSGGAWESMATINGQSGTANIQHNCPLFGRFVGTSVAELGKVYIRLHCTGQTSPVLNTDQIYVSYAVTSTDTGVNDRLAKILADTDTGIQSGVTVTGFSDTGVNERLTAIETQTGKLTFDTGNEILADIRKVNNVTVQGIGDTGTANTWRPGT
jgi:hypothetical protein